MDSPVVSTFPQSEGPKRYQIGAILALCREGFDHNGMMAIAKLYHAQGEGGVDYFIHSFLKATKDVALEELANWAQAVEEDDFTRRVSQTPAVEISLQNCIDRIIASILPPSFAGGEQVLNVSNKRVRTEEAQPIASTNVNANSQNLIPYSTELCTKLGCKKIWKREGHFTNHFAKHLDIYRDKNGCWKCCGQTFSDGLPFSKHVWAHHMRECTSPAMRESMSGARVRPNSLQNLPTINHTRSHPTSASGDTFMPIMFGSQASSSTSERVATTSIPTVSSIFAQSLASANADDPMLTLMEPQSENSFSPQSQWPYIASSASTPASNTMTFSAADGVGRDQEFMIDLDDLLGNDVPFSNT